MLKLASAIGVVSSAALVAAPADAAARQCPVATSDGTEMTVTIDDDGRAFTAFGVAANRIVGASAHECTLMSRAGDRDARWRSDAQGSFARIENPDVGVLRLTIQRVDGRILVSTEGAPGEPALCGTFALPPTILISETSGGGCRATLPGNPR